MPRLSASPAALALAGLGLAGLGLGRLVLARRVLPDLALALLWTCVSASAAPRQASLPVSVTNHRESAVEMLSFASDEDTGEHANLLKHPIEPGATVTLTIKAKPGHCSFTVVGRFADGTDFSGAGLDLCNDHKLVLVD